MLLVSTPASLTPLLACLLCRAQAHREKRLAQQDAKRQKLRQELEKKEREGERTRNEEEQARARLKVSCLGATTAACVTAVCGGLRVALLRCGYLGFGRCATWQSSLPVCSVCQQDRPLCAVFVPVCHAVLCCAVLLPG